MNILQLDANFTQNGVDIIYVGIFSKIIKVFFSKLRKIILSVNI